MPDENPSLPPRTVLILGGGIHGAAIARELVLNGASVVLVDTGDLCAGATSKSSRLIHGGLRYLEYGDVRLVRESLIERGRLLKLAPQFVRPLRLFVPTQRRWSGLVRSALGFFKLARTRLGRRLMGRTERRAPRGYWPIRIGLWMYDLFSWGDGLPKSLGGTVSSSWSTLPASSQYSSTEAQPATPASTPSSVQHQHPQVDPRRYKWLCEYSDGQMRYPERCVLALLAEADQVAKDQGISLRVIPYAELKWRDSSIRICGQGREPIDLQPDVVINTSGAWGDLTLRGIDASATPLFAGTKGSHFVTRHTGLKAALGDQGVYAETGDRRLAFILPFGDSILVGTTDEQWSGPPDQAVASDEELNYLVNVVQTVFDLTLTRADIESHYSGVRPLPRTTDTSHAAISRDHSLVEHRLHGRNVITLVGGKLTTFRAVGERIADRVLDMLNLPRVASTTDRIIYGGENFPRDPTQWNVLWSQWAAEYGSTLDEIAALWPLYGMRTKAILADVASQPLVPAADTLFSRRTICWIIRHEWITTLDDLIERRLLLIFAPRLTIGALHDLADCLVQTNQLPPESLPTLVDATRRRLETHYGRIVPE